MLADETSGFSFKYLVGGFEPEEVGAHQKDGNRENVSVFCAIGLKRSRMCRFLKVFIILFTILFALPSFAQSKRVDAVQVNVGVDAWKDLNRVKFTWTLPAKNLSRTYDWNLKSGEVEVTLEKEKRRIRASGKGLTDPADIAAHQAFINDSYWLLFEFHTQWDSVKFTNVDVVPEGVPAGSVGVSVEYGSGGYTPGDRYVLWGTPDGQITHWQYFPGGAKEAKFLMTREGWQANKGTRMPTVFKAAGETFIEITGLVVE